MTKTMPLTANHVVAELKKRARPSKAILLAKFFRTEPGGYGEGDLFLGIMVPEQRQVAKQFHELPPGELQELLDSPWHECRLTGLLILVARFERAYRRKRTNPALAEAIVNFYLTNLSAINNWDLVDSSAPKILGRWLLDHREKRIVLDSLSFREVLWERRIAILATMPLIHAAQFDEILRLSERLLDDKHDLMHKAIGWMLREMGKQDADVLREFLEMHVSRMPRTMLRYALEKLSLTERKYWLAR